LRCQKEDQDAVLATLSPHLQGCYEAYKLVLLDPSAIESRGALRQPVIVSGFARSIEKQGPVIGDVLWAYVGKGGLAMREVPVVSVYQTYLLRDSRKNGGLSSPMAYRKGPQLPSEQRIRVAGVLSELRRNFDNVRSHRFLLKAVYYSVIHAEKSQAAPRDFKTECPHR
jgi:hypothetical protein